MPAMGQGRAALRGLSCLEASLWGLGVFLSLQQVWPCPVVEGAQDKSCLFSDTNFPVKVKGPETQRGKSQGALEDTQRVQGRTGV